MNSVVVSVIVFACVFGSSLIAMILRRRLPEHHWGADSKEVVKMGMGFIASLAALVLGLLIATAKGNYDAQSGAVNELAANYLLLDRVLVRYGDEMREPRELLKKNLSATIIQIWPEGDGQVANLAPAGEAKSAGENLYDRISSALPANEKQRELRSRAVAIMTDVAQARMRLVARQDSSLPVAFLAVLAFWLSILFFGYGLLAPGNSTVFLVLLVCEMSVAGAVFLMLELMTPFAGVMRVSSDPLRHALTMLGQ